MPTNPLTNTSTQHVIETLRVLASNNEPLGLPEVSSMLNLPHSTAHRALMTLEEAGFAERTRYAVQFQTSPVVHHLIRSMVHQFPARKLAADMFREISKEHDVTITLNWRVGWYCMRLYSVEGVQEAHQRRRIGEQRMLHDGVGPSTILASLPKSELTSYESQVDALRRPSDRKYDPKQVAKFDKQLSAENYTSYEAPNQYGLDWVSRPIQNHDGDTVASVSIGIGKVTHNTASAELAKQTVLSKIDDFQSTMSNANGKFASPYDACDPDSFNTQSSPSLYRIEQTEGS